jgi:signal transduction histidine kinase
MWGLSFFGIALTAVVVASYSYTLRQIEHDAGDLQAEIASVTANRIHTFVRRKIERFSDMAAAVSLYELGSKEQQLLASLLVKNDGSFTDVSIIDARGMEVLKVSDRRVYFPSDFSDQSKSAKFNKAIKGENYISRVHTSDKAQPYVTLAIPLWGTAQSTVGVVSAEADLSFLWEAIGEIRFGASGYAYLVDEQGNLIAHKDPLLVLKKMNLRQADGVQKFLRNPTRSDPTPAHKGRGLMDRPVLSTYAPVPALGWAVILEEPLDAALANAETLKRYALALLAISLLVGAAVITWVSSRMTGPIQELHEGAKTIGSGNLDFRVNIKTGDEIEWLAEEFNKMAAELKGSYDTLEQKVEDKTADLEKANSELEQINEELVRANKGKDEFLSVISHELRTPLNVIMGYTGMIRDRILGEINPEQEKALAKVVSRSKELLAMIMDILHSTSIEAQAIVLENEEINLCHFLEDLRAGHEIPVDKELVFHWDLPPAPVNIKTDPGKLKHVLQNLINNAVKFTPSGHITISARQCPTKNIMELKVADTGIGIPEDALPFIFDRFRQVDSSETRLYGGVGIGLYVAKKMTDLLGGKIDVQSSPGKGSTFTVAIPT